MENLKAFDMIKADIETSIRNGVNNFIKKIT